MCGTVLKLIISYEMTHYLNVGHLHLIDPLDWEPNRIIITGSTGYEFVLIQLLTDGI